MKRRRFASALALVATFFIAGCAHRTGANGAFPAEAQWNGRLALKVQTEPPQAFSADFELGGSPQSGLLVFFTPLGTTAARLHWAPGVATLLADGETRQFDSLAALAQQATGAELPVRALFDWLNGQASTPAGWQVDLSQWGQGRIQAERQTPAPAVQLKVVLER